MKRFKRVMKKIGKGILVVIIVLAVVHSIASYILGRRLEAKIAEIKAQGDPVSTLDLGRNTVPDSENAAGIYLKIFEMMDPHITYKKGVPYWNKVYHVPQWKHWLLQGKSKSPTTEVWVATRESLADYNGIRPLVDKAISMPHCKFAANWEDADQVVFPHLGKMRSIALFYHASALVNVHYGDMDAAVGDATRIFGIGKSVSNEPAMLGQLMRYVIINEGFNCIRYISRNGFNENQIEMLEKSFLGISAHTGFATALENERASAIMAFKKLLSGENTYLMTGNPFGGKLLIRDRILLYLARPFLYSSMMAYLDTMSRYINEKINPILYRKEYDVITKGSFEMSLVEGWLLPAFSGFPLAKDKCEAGILSCRTMLNLMKYKHQFGAYPESLDVLRSKLKVDVPVDPMSGRDFVYKRQGDGFFLYSIGANIRDDGGKSVASPHETEPDDIVWSMTK
ncbi:MAG: hypothetical protein ACYC0V_02945 [Armatimonadota bacterium]